MTLSTNPGAFKDVERVLDAALKAGGGVYHLPTPAEATRWVARAYRYRSILFNLKAEEYAHMPGLAASTPYDHMLLRKDGAAVRIEFMKPTGSLVALDGKPIDLEDQRETAPAEFLFDEETERLVKELDLGPG